MKKTPPLQQRGAALFIALVMLLVVTLLALSSTRETALESRLVSAYTLQQNVSSSAEMGLRDGENWLAKPILPLTPTSTCTSATTACLLTLTGGAYSYTVLFGTANKSRAYGPTNGTEANPGTSIAWYGLPAPSGSEDGESENPEYGSMLVGTGVFRYELNSQATHTNTGAKVLLRSTTAKLFDAGL